MRAKSHFINNEWISGSGPEFHSINPATEETVWEGREATSGEVDRAVAAGAHAFEAWADLNLPDRTRYLEAFSRQVDEHGEELAEIISRETGKPRWESLTEVAAIKGKIGLAVRAYNERCRVVEGDLGGAHTAVRFKPHGVVAVIGPFNLPGHLPNGHIAPALIAGNTVVFKPSTQTPMVARKMVELWHAAELPGGVLNLIQGSRTAAAALVANPDLKGLFFTGGAAGGRALHRAFAGRPEIILALEMGGNNPLVVDRVSDLDAAAYLTVQSAFITSGQRCTCARRLIVPRGEQGDRFIDRLVALMGKIRVGAHTENPEPFMGPVISKRIADELLAAQEDLRKCGGTSLAPLTRIERPGAFLSPGLMDVTNVRDRQDVEVFGPLLQLIRVRDFDDAIREANNTAFGLSAGLLSDDRDRHLRFFRRIRAGIINWNRQITGASGAMPFGGVGSSGNHRPSGYYAADYCSYPIASMESSSVEIPANVIPGLDL